MKNSLLIFIFAFTFLNVSNFSYASDDNISQQQKLEDKDIFIKATGMVCDACVQTLTKVFGKEDSVVGIIVNIADQSILVDTKDNQTLSDDKIKEIIEWGGFDLVSIERLKS